jgi:hypothetical protein
VTDTAWPATVSDPFREALLVSAATLRVNVPGPVTAVPPVAVSQLTPEQRQVIMLKYVEDWDNQAIAAAIGKPVGAVKSLQHRALESLRRMLKEQPAFLDGEYEHRISA